jgi:hypothetical protein
MNENLTKNFEILRRRLDFLSRLAISHGLPPLTYQAILDASAEAMVLHGTVHVANNPELVSKYLIDGVVAPRTKWKLERRLPRSKVIERIAQGGLKSIKGLFNGDFIFGLKVGGGIVRWRKGEKKVAGLTAHTRLPITNSLKLLKPFFYKTYEEAGSRRYLIHSPAIDFYPPETGDSASVVAGILGCSKYRDGWMELPTTDFTKELFDKWTILYKEDGSVLKVCIFYFVLFSPWMPAPFWDWLKEESRRKGRGHNGCPEIPVAYWGLGYGVKGERLTKTNCLPFAPSKKYYEKKRLKHKDVHGMGRGIGIYHIHPKLKVVLDLWVKNWRLLKGASMIEILGSCYKELLYSNATH